MSAALRRRFAIAHAKRCVWEITRHALQGELAESMIAELQWCREEFAIAASECRGGYS